MAPLGIDAGEKVTLTWPEVLANDRATSGAKAWNLARLHSLGYPVPPGFVVSAALSRNVLSSPAVRALVNALPALEARDIADPAFIELLSDIRAAIRSAEMSCEATTEIAQALRVGGWESSPCAVRSSGIAEDGEHSSFAGIHETSLNVRCVTPIIAHILACIASAWQPRAVAYRARFAIPDDDALIAVIVMPMIEADAGGVLFTADPLTGDRSVACITASFGLPVSVVDGQGNPDHYVMAISSFTCRPGPATIAHKQTASRLAPAGGVESLALPPYLHNAEVLSERERIGLSVLALSIQNALAEADTPFDIEWAKAGDQFLILQARPVSVVDFPTRTPAGNLPAVWSSANLKDASPGVQSALGTDLMRSILREVLLTPFRYIRYDPARTMTLFKFINGRPYLNMTAMQWAYYDALGVHPGELNDAIGGHQGEQVIPGQHGEPMALRLRRSVMRMGLLLAALATIPRFLIRQGAWSAHADREHRQSWSGFTPCQLLQVARLRQRRVSQAGAIFQIMNSVAGAGYGLLVQAISGAGMALDSSLAPRLLAGAGGVSSATYVDELYALGLELRRDPELSDCVDAAIAPAEFVRRLELATSACQFKRKFGQFLGRVGHRAVYEMEIANARWEEDPGFLLENIRLFAREDRRERDPYQIFDRACEELRGLARRHPVRWLVMRGAVGFARSGVRLRENAKSMFVKSAQPLRTCFLELGAHLVRTGQLAAPQDVFHLSWWDMVASVESGYTRLQLSELAAIRSRRARLWDQTTTADLVFSKASAHVNGAAAAPAPLGSRIRGIAVSAGRSTGVARFIDHPSQFAQLQPGDILIAATSDPAWTPLFFRASAVVLGMGGMLSHGAILARELGIPAVTNVGSISVLIADGDTILVDGDKGEVFLAGAVHPKARESLAAAA